jgi:hypothetical protein
MKYKDLEGKRFGRLVVIKFSHKKEKNNSRKYYFLCKCDCGKEKTIEASALIYNKTISCGCYHSEKVKRPKNKDVKVTTNKSLYSRWSSLKQRCYDKNNSRYKNYGARGIKVCDEWLGKNGSENFIRWALQNGYNDDLTIDRIDVNGDYCPENCRWVSNKEQASNKTTNVFVFYNGDKKTIREWSLILKVNEDTLYRRKKKGWCDKKIIETPIRKHKEYRRMNNK